MRKRVIAIAIFQSIAIMVFLLRGILFTPGMMQSIDIIWSYHISVIQNSLHTFNPALAGDNSMFLSVFWYSAIAFLTNSAEVMQKALYAIVFFLIAFVSFSVFFSIIRQKVTTDSAAYFGALAASVIYTINPNIVPQFFHLSFLWGYMFLPLVAYFTLNIISAKSLRLAFRNSIFLSLVFPFMADARAMFIGALVFIVIVVWNLFYQTSKRQLFFYLKNLAFSSLIVVLFAGLISAFWLFSYIEVKPFAYWAITSSNTIANNSPSIFNMMVNLWYPQPFFAISGVAQLIWVISIVIPVVAMTALLIKPRDRIVQTLSVLSLVFLFLGKGFSEPLGGFYVWLSSDFPRLVGLQSLFDMVLKYPSLFVSAVTLSFSLLAGFMVAYVFGRLKFSLVVPKQFFASTLCIRNFAFGLLLVSILVFSTAFSSFPLITGNMSGAVAPVELPPEYRAVNDYLNNNVDNSRVIFFPESTTYSWGSGFINKAEYFAVSSPVLSYGWGTVPSPNMGFFGDLVYDSLLNGNIRNVGNLLSLANVKSVVFHNDTIEDNATSLQFSNLYNNILNQSDLQLTLHGDSVDLFTTQADSQYIYTVNRTLFVVGGLDALLPLCSATGTGLNNRSIIFLEQYPLNYTYLRHELGSGNNTVILYGNKDFNDFVLDTVGQQYYVAPVNFLVETYPLTSWSKETYSDFYWSQQMLGQYSVGGKYDFDLGGGIIYTSVMNSSIDVSFNLPESEVYESWIRVLQNPSGGNISLKIDGQPIGTVVTKVSSLNGFKWINVANVSLAEGTHTATITSQDGFNAINLLSFIPQAYINNYSRELLSQPNICFETLTYTGNMSGNLDSSGKLPFITNWVEISPTKYIVNVNSSSPFMLVFSEPFNGLWSAHTGGDYYDNIPVYSMMNGFWVNKTGAFSVTIEYTPEHYLIVGTEVTIFSIAIAVVCLIFTLNGVSSRISRLLHLKKGC